VDDCNVIPHQKGLDKDVYDGEGTKIKGGKT
jgi:hypothetical protein